MKSTEADKAWVRDKFPNLSKDEAISSDLIHLKKSLQKALDKSTRKNSI